MKHWIVFYPEYYSCAIVTDCFAESSESTDDSGRVEYLIQHSLKTVISLMRCISEAIVVTQGG